MKNLTDRQKEVLDFIESYIRENPYPPTIREIAEHFDISVKGAYDHVKALEKKGRIRAGENRSRTIELMARPSAKADRRPSRCPSWARSPRASPSSPRRTSSRAVHVPAAMVGAARCFALRVRGDSMINAGILDGDIAVIEQKPIAENGEIVVAMIDDSVTLKRFFKEKGRIRLAPENPAYSPIFTQDVRILGKLRGIVRTY